MSSLLYIVKKSLKNNIKIALKRVSTYFILIGMLCLIGMILLGNYALLEVGVAEQLRGDIQIQYGVYIFFAFLLIVMILARMGMIASKRAVATKLGHTHFVFPAPISPKLVFIFPYLGQIFIIITMFMLFFLFAYTIFGVSLLAIFLCLCGLLVIGICLCSLIIIIYGYRHERDLLSDGLSYILYGIIGIAVLYLIFIIVGEVRTYGDYIEVGELFFKEHSLFLSIPIVGWAVALFKGAFLGYTTFTLVLSILLIVTTAGLAVYAYQMETLGSCYEDIINYSKVYLERKKRARAGQMQWNMSAEERPVNKKARVQYQGSGAKAIMYRQILEARRTHSLIFSMRTRSNLIMSVVFILYLYQGIQEYNYQSEIAEYGMFILLPMIAYTSLFFAAFKTKWAQEISNIYIFLIPDTASKKVWYGTFVERMQIFLEAAVMILPISLLIGIPLPYILAMLLLYVAIENVMLHVRVICQSVLAINGGKFLPTLATFLIHLLLVVFGTVVIIFGSMAIDFVVASIALSTIYLVIAYITYLMTISKFKKMEVLTKSEL